MKQGFGLLSWVLILGVFYILLIMPEKKKQKKMKEMMDAVAVGDKILTRGGILGKIVSIEEDYIVVESGPDAVKLSMSRYAIGQVIEKAASSINSEVVGEVKENSNSYTAVEIKDEEK